MFICTFDEKVFKELNGKLKLLQKITNNGKVLYIFPFDKVCYEKFDKNKIFISNKLYF